MLTDLVEPPLTGNERDALIGMLDYYRVVLVRKADGLSDAQLRQRLEPSTLTIGRLIYHSAFVEDYWFSSVFSDGGAIEPWADADWDSDPDWEMSSSESLKSEEILAQFAQSLKRSQTVLGDVASLDELSHGNMQSRRGPVSMRWILVHLIEEYARHCGHADFLREAIDGRTGD